MSIQTRPDVVVPTRPATIPPKRARHRRRAATAIVITIFGAGLTTLLLGVTDGSRTEVPPGPGVAPVAEDAAPSPGADQRLYNLAEQRAAERRGQLQLDRGADQRLYNLAEQRAAERRERLQLDRGADQRLYNLAGSSR